MDITNKCEAFDMAIALWYWCTHNYSKFDAKHEAFCKITEDYKLSNIPSIDFDSTEEDDYDMVRMMYHNITEDNWEQTYQDFCDFMDNEWENEY